MKNLLIFTLLTSTALLLFSCENFSPASDDIFLIPKSFTGKVTVIYNQPNGQEKEFEGKYRLYHVPSNGILNTQFEMKNNRFKYNKFYFVDEYGKRELIKGYNPNYTDEDEDGDTTSVHIVAGIIGSKGETPFITFFVGKPNEANNLADTLVKSTTFDEK